MNQFTTIYPVLGNMGIQHKIDFYLVNDAPNNPTVGKPVTMEPLKEGEYQQATFSLTEKQAQVLMDRLWNVGVRPSSEPSRDAYDMQRRHLNDMRKIVSKTLEIPLGD